MLSRFCRIFLLTLVVALCVTVAQAKNVALLVEEIPVDDTPQTGDWFSLPIWLALAAAAAIALAVAIVKNRRARKA